jgi:hypothetical protein
MAAKRSNSFDDLAKTLTGVIAGIQANLGSTRQIPAGGQSVSVSSLLADFQSFVDKNTEVDAAKANTLALVVERKQLRTTTKKKLKDFMKWLELQFGVGVFSQYSLPIPQPRTTSPAKQAIGVAKRKAISEKKKAAREAAAPVEEKIVAYDSAGNAINAEPAPTAPVAPAASAPSK